VSRERVPCSLDFHFAELSAVQKLHDENHFAGHMVEARYCQLKPEWILDIVATKF
jgi:hypothetical protein